jgi:hypothetical protein
MKQRVRRTEHEQADDQDAVPPEASDPPAMAPIITNTGDDEDGAPTG